MNNEFVIDQEMQMKIEDVIHSGIQEHLYDELIEYLIRQKYHTPSKELAIQRQRDSKPLEFQEYNAYCERCKAYAKELLNLSN